MNPGLAKAQDSPLSSSSSRATLAGHISICRFDHWVKNVFVLPGIVLGMTDSGLWSGLLERTALGMLSVGLVASSNYIINEILDAPTDLHHPVKRLRPIPSGRVSIPLAYLQWLLFMLAGVGVALLVSTALAWTMVFLWVMGIVYNVKPLRTKDVAYLDVVSESVNNPIRMLAGWFIAGGPKAPPASLLASYWMVGAYFMAIKRFAEFREIADHRRLAAYRKSFASYTEPSLLVSIMFYASSAMLMFGAFLARYRMEMILGVPLIALVMAIYLKIAFEPNSAVQHPEYLYKNKLLVFAVTACAVVLVAMLFIDVPQLYKVFSTQYSGFRPGQ